MVAIFKLDYGNKITRIPFLVCSHRDVTVAGSHKTVAILKENYGNVRVSMIAYHFWEPSINPDDTQVSGDNNVFSRHFYTYRAVLTSPLSHVMACMQPEFVRNVYKLPPRAMAYQTAKPFSIFIFQNSVYISIKDKFKTFFRDHLNAAAAMFDEPVNGPCSADASELYVL